MQYQNLAAKQLQNLCSREQFNFFFLWNKILVGEEQEWNRKHLVINEDNWWSKYLAASKTTNWDNHLCLALSRLSACASFPFWASLLYGGVLRVLFSRCLRDEGFAYNAMFGLLGRASSFINEVEGWSNYGILSVCLDFVIVFIWEIKK